MYVDPLTLKVRKVLIKHAVQRRWFTTNSSDDTPAGENLAQSSHGTYMATARCMPWSFASGYVLNFLIGTGSEATANNPISGKKSLIDTNNEPLPA